MKLSSFLKSVISVILIYVCNNIETYSSGSISSLSCSPTEVLVSMNIDKIHHININKDIYKAEGSLSMSWHHPSSTRYSGEYQNDNITDMIKTLNLSFLNYKWHNLSYSCQNNKTLSIKKNGLIHYQHSFSAVFKSPIYLHMIASGLQKYSITIGFANSPSAMPVTFNPKNS